MVRWNSPVYIMVLLCSVSFFTIYEMTGTFMTFEDKKLLSILKVVFPVAFPGTRCCLRGVSGMLFLTVFFLTFGVIYVLYMSLSV